MGKNTKTLSDLLSIALENFLPEKIFFAEASPPPPIKAIMPKRARLLIGIEGVRKNIFSYKGKITEMEMRKGDLLYASPSAWHKPVRSHLHSLINIIFDKEFTNIAWKGDVIHCNSYHPPISRSDPDIFYLLKSINSLPHPNEQESAPDLIKALLKMTQDYINTTNRQAINKPQSAWLNICNYLEDNFNIDSISRESVAQMFNMHPNHVSRLFKIHGDESFSTRLNRLRMENAMFLLKTDKTTSIKEISDRCGFESANYFCRAFKRFSGKSPGKYQRSAS